ncbi:hypothetical protein XaFJ1_GM002498 [Xanthomonas albilineans]|nr:hypothetical protein XaFJ1_GM002498 [Xanthomonas albilineans]
MLARGVWIGRGVGVAMVIAMVRGPPQWPTLHASGAERGEQELHWARGLERAVSEIAVVEAGESEHAHCVQGQRHTHRASRHADPENAQAGQMQADIGGRPQPVDAVGARRVQLDLRVGVEPLAQRAQHMLAPRRNGRSGWMLCKRSRHKGISLGTRDKNTTETRERMHLR